MKKILVVFTGLSATGKTTISNLLKKNQNNIYEKVITYTTRPPRVGERDGIDYFFITREEFLKKISDKNFLEYTEYSGNFYGTLTSSIITQFEKKDVLMLCLDISGTLNLIKNKDLLPSNVKLLPIFLYTNSIKILVERMKQRQDSIESIKKRESLLLKELSNKEKFDITVEVNRSLIEIYEEILNIINSELGY